MTTMTGRCRRNHQRTCEGPTTGGLCVKHRKQWAAMQKDWDARAKETDKRPAPLKRAPWRAWEDNAVRTLAPKDAVAALPHRTKTAVMTRRATLGIGTGVMWTEQEDAIILQHSLKKASKLLPGRTYFAVSERRRRIGSAKPRPAKTGQAGAA